MNNMEVGEVVVEGWARVLVDALFKLKSRQFVACFASTLASTTPSDRESATHQMRLILPSNNPSSLRLRTNK